MIVRRIARSGAVFVVGSLVVLAVATLALVVVLALTVRAAVKR